MTTTLNIVLTKIKNKISEIQAMQKSTPENVDYNLFRKLQILKQLRELISEYLKL